MYDDKIFIYIRLKNEARTLLKSRTREFMAIGKTLADFVKTMWKEFGIDALKQGSLEYVDANADLVLISFKQDDVKQRFIISGFIPKKYQARMLNGAEAKTSFSAGEFIQHAMPRQNVMKRALLEQRVQNPLPNILELIKQNINENGEFYIFLDTKISRGM